MIALFTGLAFLAGPFVALGIWLWLRSRRAPVRLAGPLDMGKVLGDTFAVFRPGNWVVLALAFVLIGLPVLIWQLGFQPAMQAGLQAQSQLPPALRANPLAVFASAFTGKVMIAMLLNYVLGTTFYVIATQWLVARYEDRTVSIAEALRPVPVLLLPAMLVPILAYLAVVLGMMLFVVPGIVLALSWSIVVPVLVVERTGMIRCFGRSRALAIGSRGRILLLLLLVFLLAMALSASTGSMSAAFRPGALPQQPGPIGIVLHVILTTASAAIFAAFFAGLYVELRRIREGRAMPDLAEVFA